MQFDSTKDHPNPPLYGIANLVASGAKKVGFDWPVAGAAGFARKFAPFAPVDKWEGKLMKPSTWDLDPGDQHGLFDYFNIWNPSVLRGPGEIEKWFNPAINYAADKLGFDYEKEGSVINKGLDAAQNWLNEKGEYIEERGMHPTDAWALKTLGYDDDQIAEMNQNMANVLKNADADVRFNEFGFDDRKDKISIFGDGVHSVPTELQQKYTNLQDVVANADGERAIMDNMEGIWKNPAYYKVDDGSNYFNYVSNFDSSFAQDISKQAFLNNADAVKLAQIVGAENTKNMDLFFIDTSQAPLENLNSFFNNWTGDENNNPTIFLTSNSPTLVTGLRKLAGATSMNRYNDGELAQSEGQNFALHASDVSGNISDAYDMVENKNDYMFFSPSEKTSAAIFDMRELPIIGDWNLGSEKFKGLKESIAHGTETPWMDTPEELKPYEAFLKREHVQMTPDGLQVVPYDDELISSQQEAWAALDPEKQKELMSLWHAPVDAAIVGAVARRPTKKLIDRGIRSLDIDPLMSRAIDQAARDTMIQERMRLR
jgi:hypothetical protein